MKREIVVWVSAVLGLLLGGAVAAQPVISEFLADPEGEGALVDEDGEVADWIEIENRGEVAVDLGGYALSDDSAMPFQWVFPSRVLPPGGRLLVMATGKDRRRSEGELHANFALDRNGEPLILVAPGGSVVDGYPLGFPPQRAGVSYGRARSLTGHRALGLGSPCRYRVPTAPVNGWETRAFFDGAWTAGSLALGYDLDGEYASIIGAGSDTQATMYNLRSSAYVRVPFTIDTPSRVRALELRMKYDDGIDAYINGVKVASRYMEERAAWDSVSTQNRIDALNDRYESFDVDAAIGGLVSGANVLAIQGANFTASGLDFLIDPELWVWVDDGGEGFDGFFEKPTPGAPNNRAVRGFVADTKFSTNRGFYAAPFELVISSATPGAVIRYTVDGVPPTATTGEVYAGPLRVASTMTVRAAAFRDGYRETNVDAHTYLFTADIRLQPEMRPSVVNAPAYTAQIEPALRSLPVVALSLRDTDFFGSNGIYSLAALSGRAQEVEVSFEFFDPADGRSVQTTGGIRIHGGNARTHPKKPLRLYFRGAYGDARLGFPLFGESRVERFDQLILRPGGHDSWSLADTFGATSTDLPPHATFMRDQFLRRTEVELGLLSPHGRYVNLFINGRYWGLYDLHERPNAAYFADHLGGPEEAYDVVHHPEFVGDTHAVVDGSGDSWEALVERAALGIESSSAYAEIQDMLAVDDFIDHIIVRMWSGDYDWCGPIYRGNQDVSVFGNKNWYAGRRARGDNLDPFRLFTWDAEMSMGSHLMINLTGLPTAQRVANFDLTRANDPGSPAGLYDALRQNAAFRLRFADRLQKHFFNGGMMSVAANAARWSAMEAEIEGAVVGESARWGHETATVFTRDGHWRPEVAWVKNSFIPARTTTLLAQFRTAGLWPVTVAPTFSQLGGVIAADGSSHLRFTAAAGATVYFTTDGSDPLIPPSVEVTALVGEDAPVSVLVPSVANGGDALGSAWQGVEPPANEADWTTGVNGVGYETSPEAYAELIRTPVPSMIDTNGSVYIRIPFDIADAATLAAIRSLRLKMRYDDGFVAYLNGNRVAAANAPATPAYNSLATGNQPDSLAVAYETFELSGRLDVLRVGQNMLAIHGLNDGLVSSDLLMQALLEAGRGTESGLSPDAIVYTEAITLTQPGVVRARALSAEGEWSPLNEARFFSSAPASASNLVVSEIAYRPLGPSTAAEAATGATGRGAFEFIEIMNTATVPVDLKGVRFATGVTFDFTASAITSLAPGARAVVVAQRAAFAARYGTAASAAVAGEFAGGTQLANEGESIELTAADGSIIQRFGYSPRAPWPEAADGLGYSVELIDPAGLPDHGNPLSWRASLDIGGTPGGSSLTDYAAWTLRYFDSAARDFALRSAPGADPDGDGLVNRWEHLLASHPGVPNGSSVRTDLIGDGDETFLSIEAALRPGMAGAIRAESAEALQSWSSDGTVFHEAVARPSDGRELVRFRSTTPLRPGTLFLRFATEP